MNSFYIWYRECPNSLLQVHLLMASPDYDLTLTWSAHNHRQAIQDNETFRENDFALIINR